MILIIYDLTAGNPITLFVMNKTDWLINYTYC